MIKLGILTALIVAISGFAGMIWTSEKGYKARGISERVYYSLFVISFITTCVLAPLIFIIFCIAGAMLH